jgi:blue copper oxidase
LLGGSVTAVATALATRQVRAATDPRQSPPIPTQLKVDAGRRINLQARPGWMQFLSGGKTATHGINGPLFLAAAVHVRRGQKVAIHVANLVPQEITMHWNGLIIPSADDGGPHNII